MSEKGLDNTIRELRVAKEHLEMAEVYSESQVSDHNVTSMIHDVNLSLQEVVKFLKEDYRQTHYPHRR